MPPAHPSPGPKCSQFHAVFLENLAKSYVGAPSWRVGAPSYRKSWIRPWLPRQIAFKVHGKSCSENVNKRLSNTGIMVQLCILHPSVRVRVSCSSSSLRPPPTCLSMCWQWPIFLPIMSICRRTKINWVCHHWRIQWEAPVTRPPPRGPNSFIFM